MQRYYRRDLWTNQPQRAIVLVEKDALLNVLAPVTSALAVPVGSTKGQSSDTFAWELGEWLKCERNPVRLFHFGDHDPSGVAAWENLQLKLRRFAPDAEVEFKRLTVVPSQLVKYGEDQIPSRATNHRDVNYGRFMERYGHVRGGRSVEVEAIPPRILRSLLTKNVERMLDPDLLAQTKALEAADRTLLKRWISG